MSGLPNSAVCLHCGYSLRGLPENVCPECGKPFDPANPLTWHDSTSPPAAPGLMRQVAALFGILLPTPPTRRDLAVAVFLTLIFVPWVCIPWRTPYTAVHAVLGCISALLTFYCSSVTMFLIGRKVLNLVLRSLRTPHANLHDRQALRRLQAVWICTLVCLWTVICPQTLNWGRLWLSRGAFTRRAQSVRASHRPDFRSQWVGLVHVDRIGLLGSSVQFQLVCSDEGGFFTLTHCPRISSKGSGWAILGPGWRFEDHLWEDWVDNARTVILALGRLLESLPNRL